MGMSPRLLRPRASGFTPKSIANLGLWLDASDTSSLTFNGSTVSEWRDLSGNGRHFAQDTAGNQPTGDNRTQNGRRVLNFDGGDYLLGNAASLSICRKVGGFTMIVVAKDDETAFFNRSLASVGTGAATSVTRAIFQSPGSQARLVARRLDSDSPVFIQGARSFVSLIHTAVLDFSNDDAFYYHSGSLLASSTSFLTAGSTSDTDSFRVTLGCNVVLSEAWLGYIAEVIYYQRAISTAERQRVERYLGKKWGITVA